MIEPIYNLLYLLCHLKDTLYNRLREGITLDITYNTNADKLMLNKKLLKNFSWKVIEKRILEKLLVKGKYYSLVMPYYLCGNLRTSYAVILNYTVLYSPNFFQKMFCWTYYIKINAKIQVRRALLYEMYLFSI